MSRAEPHPHQLTPEECADDTERTPQNQAKAAAYEAYHSANRVLVLLDETADAAWLRHAQAIRDHAWLLYTALVNETEW